MVSLVLIRMARAGGVSINVRLAVALCLFGSCLGAQTPAIESADGATPRTQAEAVELETQDKASGLQPDAPTTIIDRGLNFIKERRIVERLTTGVAGLRLRFGGPVTGSGFGLGPEFYVRSLMRNRVTFQTSAVGTTKLYYMLDARLSAPSLAGNRLFLDFYANHRDSPQIDYYGPGPNSDRNGRSNFRLEDTLFELVGGVNLSPRLRIGGVGRYYLVNVGPGRGSRFISADQIYGEDQAPGIQNQTDFLAGGAVVQYDWRDNRRGPRRGGNYVAEYTRYSDRRLGQFSFDRLNLEAQQYIGFFSQRRIIALRARLQAADALSGQRTPFYLQPTLGGSNDLRGFRSFRFYDNSSIVLNAEYRWQLFSRLGMALFADAGKVFPDWRQINLRTLEKSLGFGFRFNLRNDAVLRIDTGFSREGFQIWTTFSNAF